MGQLRHQDLSEKIIAAAYAVHDEMGCGFIEKVYQSALAIELEEMGVPCSCELPLHVAYRGKIVGEYCADIVVANKIVVETKAASRLDPIHEVQLVNYLRATGLSVGLLINFGRSVEIKRRIFDASLPAEET